MEKSYFFDSVEGDQRSYLSEDWANYFKRFIEEGIYQEDDNLEVTANGSSMDVNVGMGSAFLRGRMYVNDSSHPLTIDTADPTYNRIDRVVLRLDLNTSERYIKAFILKGVPDANPQPPSLTDNDYVYEFTLAQVLVEAGQSTIDQIDITDERPSDFVNPFVDGTRLTNLEDEVTAHKAEDVTNGDSPHGMIYEEGTWTPEIWIGGSSGTNTYNNQIGHYIRKNNEIHVFFDVELSSLDTGLSGEIDISGLPFMSNHSFINVASLYWDSISLPSTSYSITGLSTGDKIRLYHLGENRGLINESNLKNTTFIRGTLIYKT